MRGSFVMAESYFMEMQRDKDEPARAMHERVTSTYLHAPNAHPLGKAATLARPRPRTTASAPDVTLD